MRKFWMQKAIMWFRDWLMCISMVQRVMISVTQIQTDFPILRLTCIPAVLHPSVQHPWLYRKTSLWKSAQKESYLCNPSVDVFCRLLESYSGKIKLITIAPELPGADKFIEKFHDEVAISLGHSTASYEIASKAFAAFSACLEITASS